MTYVERGHLGGYIEGGDEATYYPDLWRSLVDDHGVGRIIDLGCGEGHAVDFFRGLGVDAVGIEGVPQDHPDIVRFDFTLRRWASPGRVDLVWCCEFVEHVEERFIPNYLPVLDDADLVLMTHAEPGQPGYHHVNCQPTTYWQGVMAAIGKRIDWGLTAVTRALAAKNPSPCNHYARSGLAFRGEVPAPRHRVGAGAERPHLPVADGGVRPPHGAVGSR